MINEHFFFRIYSSLPTSLSIRKYCIGGYLHTQDRTWPYICTVYTLSKSRARFERFFIL